MGAKMVIAIGVDIILHADVRALKWAEDAAFLNKYFSTQELTELSNYTGNDDKRLKYIAGRYAAKEAAVKCLGTGMEDGIALKEIKITSDKKGKPLLKMIGNTKKAGDKLGIHHWHVSISHCSVSTVAMVLGEG